MNFQAILTPSHPLKSVLREHKIFVQRMLVDAIISRGIFPTFNVQVITSVKTRAQQFFYITLHLK